MLHLRFHHGPAAHAGDAMNCFECVAFATMTCVALGTCLPSCQAEVLTQGHECGPCDEAVMAEEAAAFSPLQWLGPDPWKVSPWCMITAAKACRVLLVLWCEVEGVCYATCVLL